MDAGNLDRGQNTTPTPVLDTATSGGRLGRRFRWSVLGVLAGLAVLAAAWGFRQVVPTGLRLRSFEKGVAECPNGIYRNWVLNAAKAQAKVEEIPRKAAGTPECPIQGLPAEGRLV